MISMMLSVYIALGTNFHDVCSTFQHGNYINVHFVVMESLVMVESANV